MTRDGDLVIAFGKYMVTVRIRGETFKGTMHRVTDGLALPVVYCINNLGAYSTRDHLVVSLDHMYMGVTLGNIWQYAMVARRSILDHLKWKRGIKCAYNAHRARVDHQNLLEHQYASEYCDVGDVWGVFPMDP